eukprot:TRINITY_DN8275_c0_g4_i1.p1 TRINITY_DN8275_c0_g4~~TRINITY_DN8275_c0_g4_i1.p1  ORF type:complete len:802 (-),score=104.89 TRINITY_DN8275_c0_g4_i1:41-2335(-)
MCTDCFDMLWQTLPARSRQARRPATVTTGKLSSVDCNTCIIAISDPGQDLDDEMAFIMMRALVEEGLIDLRGIVTTLCPSFDRARLCVGTLNLLGLSRVPVGIGTDGGDTDGKHSAAPFQNNASSYMPGKNSEASMTLEPGPRLMHRLYAAAQPKSITLLIIASLKDAAIFIRDNEELFVEKTKEVVIQGGVAELPPAKGQFMEPDTSNNLTFDTKSSTYLYRRCQELGVRLILCSRWAAYAAKMPRGTYDELAELGSSIGRRLRNAQRESIEQLWARAAVGADDPSRKGLPPRCDRTWFINTFCGGNDDPIRTAADPVWDLVDGFMQYDTMALFAAVPELRGEFYEPVKVKVGKTEHLVIGVSQDKPNLFEPKDALMNYLFNGFRKGVTLNHHFKAQVIILGELREDTVVDVSLTCAMLRTLFSLGTLHCNGILTCTNSKDDAVCTEATIKILENTLNELGLRFVPLINKTDTLSTAETLIDLYNDALPIGVTLINTASLTVISKFAELNPRLFREKTARVILMGGANKREHKNSWLEPDPTAQNNRLDLEAARSFYKTAQDLSVPLVVLSRFATQQGQVPRALFDMLRDHCGSVGQSVCDVQRKSVEALWDKANAPPGSSKRGNLPERCDRAWFLSTFCNGAEFDDSRGVWDQMASFNVYSPLTLIVALPGVMRQFLNATNIEVRATVHQVIGWSADDSCVADPSGLQNVLAHYILYGCHANFSHFAGERVPALRLPSGREVELSMSERAIQAVIPENAAYL